MDTAAAAAELISGASGSAVTASLTGAGATLLVGLRILYIDVLRDYLIARLKIKNDLLRGLVDSRTAIDILEGQYHIFARQLISIAYQVARDHRNRNLREESIAQAVRTGIATYYGKTVSALHHYTHVRSGRKLDSHLRGLDEPQKRAFYAPVIAAIVAYDGEPDAIRNEVLQSIDAFATEALEHVIAEPPRPDSPERKARKQ